MITEDYVSFETAKLLKEKGFDEKCHMCWDEVIKTMESADEYATNSELLATYISAPTLQTVMKWLREVHKLFLSIQLHMNGSYVWYAYRLDGTPKGCERDSHNYSYEEACEAAIKYCLENLI